MFDGREYNDTFENACVNLSLESDLHAVRSELVWLEFVLWEAIRSALFQFALVSTLVTLGLPYFVIVEDKTWTSGGIFLAAVLIVAILHYNLLKGIIWIEIASHVKGRKFGSLKRASQA